MLLTLLILFISWSALISAQTSGTQFISYHVYGDPISASCNFYASQSQWAGYITANTFGLPCNTCVKMTAGSKTIYAVALDIGGRGFDLNMPAFCELCGAEGGFRDGGCNVNWQVVDYSYCTNFFAGKTKPNCNLCPAGSTCGNPDPNRNMGVPWDTYCPQVVQYGMTRCDMRIDGCTCYGGTPTAPPKNPPTAPPTTPPKNPPTTPPKNPPTTPPTTPPKNPPTAPPTTPPKNPPTAPPKNPPTAAPTGVISTTRCGQNWGAANTQCNNACLYPTDCPQFPGGNCFADLDPAPCKPKSLISDSEATQMSSGNIGMIVGLVLGIVVLALIIGVIAYLKIKNANQQEIV